MIIFTVQDELLVFDSSPELILDEVAQSYWRPRVSGEIEDFDFERFVDYLEVNHPKSAICRFYTKCVDKNGELNLEEAASLAASGFSPAAFLLYVMYENGDGDVPQDSAKSQAYLELSVKLNHPHAIWIYGTEVINRDACEGKRLVMLSALLGFSPAMTYIEQHHPDLGEFLKSQSILKELYDY